MEEKTNTPKKLTWGKLLANKATAAFVSLSIIYKWLGTDDAKETLTAPFNHDVTYYAIFRAIVLLAAMASVLFCGREVLTLSRGLKMTFQDIDIEDDKNKPTN